MVKTKLNRPIELLATIHSLCYCTSFDSQFVVVVQVVNGCEQITKQVFAFGCNRMVSRSKSISWNQLINLVSLFHECRWCSFDSILEHGLFARIVCVCVCVLAPYARINNVHHVYGSRLQSLLSFVFYILYEMLLLFFLFLLHLSFFLLLLFYLFICLYFYQSFLSSIQCCFTFLILKQ